MVKYQLQVTDKKAEVILTYNTISGSVRTSVIFALCSSQSDARRICQSLASLLLFYDGPKPVGRFDDFLEIPSIQSTIGSGSFFELFNTFSSNLVIERLANTSTYPRKIAEFE
jgi:hypothetical protein